MTHDDEELLADYLAEALERRDAGDTVDFGEICAEHPHLAGALAESLGMVAMLPDWHVDSSRRDRFLGRTLGDRYRLVERVGAGAMGAVYRARDDELQRDVAVKVLRQDLFGGESSVRRFLREAETLAAIEHDHIVPIYDRGQADDGDVLYLVMGFVAGPSLATVLEWSRANLAAANAKQYEDVRWLQDRMPAARFESSYLRQCARWAAEIGSALAAAHRLGIVHRDVKPSNVLVTPSGRAVLADFGIAARLEDGTLTSAGSSIGTPWYMAPEQAAGASEPDVRSDVYSLGATLYHLCALRPPFDDDPMRVLARVQTEDPPRLAALHDGLPRDVHAIVEHAMERDPDRRYDDAEAFCADVHAFLGHRPVSVRPLGPGGRVVRFAKRRPAILVAAVAVVVALLAIPVWLENERARAHAEHARRVGRLPALLTIEGFPEQRLLIGDEERESVLAELGDLLALRPDDIATRVVRLAVLQDCGDRDAAHADARVLAELDDSPFTREFATRMQRATAGVRGLAGVDFEGLPEPTTAASKFLAAFVALRDRTPAGVLRAAELLDEVRGYEPARDLRLVTLLATGEFDQAYDEALRLEGIYGGPTARTRHVVGAVSLARYDFETARLACEESIRIRPGRHGSMHNLGIALSELGHPDLAEQWFLAAHAVRPWLWNTALRLARLHQDRGDFDTALHWAEQIPESGPRGEAWIRAVTIARVHFHAALAALPNSDDTERGPACRQAELALASYARAVESGIRGRQAVSAEQEAAEMRRLLGGEQPETWERYLANALERPLHARTLARLGLELPDDRLTPEQLRAVKDLLALQSDQLIAPPIDFLRPEDVDGSPLTTDTSVHSEGRDH